MDDSTNQDRRHGNDLILQKLDQLCLTINTGFAANQTEHKELNATISKIREEQAETRGHKHDHCDDCITHSAEIKALGKRIDTRDKVGIGALLALIGTAIKSFWPGG